MQEAINTLCSGLPLPINTAFWILLFFGMGAGCASILAALTYIVAIMRTRSSAGAASGSVANLTGMMMLILAMLAFFSAAVMVRVMKVNVPEASGISLISFTLGFLVTLVPHVMVNRANLKF